MASIQSTHFDQSMSPLGLYATSNMTWLAHESHKLAADLETRWTKFLSLNVLKI